MYGAQLLLESVLVLLLAATLFHALRLEQALGVLKQDRAALESLVADFNDSTRQAEAGVERLRGTAEGAGRQIAKRIEVAQRLRDDLSFLGDRAEILAERLEVAVRSARMFGDAAALTRPVMAVPAEMPQPTDMPSAAMLPAATPPPATLAPIAPRVGLVAVGGRGLPDAAMPRLRSQAERDLLRALRAGG
jgi:hypothetical protein